MSDLISQSFKWEKNHDVWIAEEDSHTQLREEGGQSVWREQDSRALERLRL